MTVTIGKPRPSSSPARSSKTERRQARAAKRDERVRLWQEYCAKHGHGASMPFEDWLHPEKRAAFWRERNVLARL